MNPKSIDNRYSPRVAMYIWNYSPIGGAERQCERLSKELVRKGADLFIVTEFAENIKGYEAANSVRIYCVNSFTWIRKIPAYLKRFFYRRADSEGKPEYFLIDNESKLKIIIRSISGFFTYNFPNYLFFISSLWLLFLKRNDFDILHVHGAHWVAGFGVRIARLLDKRVVVKESSCGNIMTFYMQSPGSKKRTMRADLFIAVSDKAMSDLISLGIPKEKIRVIPNGVEVDDARWRADVLKDRSVICTSHITQEPIKGLDILIEAWGEIIHKYNRNNNLRIFGMGDPHLLSKLAMRLGIGDYVHFLGFTDDIKGQLLGSYLFVLPSRIEGLSNSLLEAMALGVPCVATDIPGNRDLIQRGTNGLLVPAENPEALAEAVLFMLNNPDRAADMGSEAVKTIEKKYRISVVADRYIELYKELNGGYFDGRPAGRISCENMH